MDQKEILSQIERGIQAGLSIPFASVAEQFRVIESPTRSVLIPNDDEPNTDSRKLIAALQSGAHSRELLRKAGLHSVSVYQKQYDLLLGAGALGILDEELAVLRDESLYSDKTGLHIPKDGIAVVC